MGWGLDNPSFYHAKLFVCIFYRNNGRHSGRFSPISMGQAGIFMAITPSQRLTRAWPLLVLALALVAIICIPLRAWALSPLAEDLLLGASTVGLGASPL